MGPGSAGTLRLLGGSVLTDAQPDPLTGHHVRIVAHRQTRPNLPEQQCPFCPGGLEAPEPYRTRWFTNRWPALPDGRAEVLLYSPDHDASLATMPVGDVRAVVDLWADRAAALGGRDDVAYVLIFENRGREVGATIDHPHGQLYAYDDVPPAARTELDAPHCALCAATGENENLLVLDTATWVARVPSLAAWPYELVLQPKAHTPDLVSLDNGGRDGLAACLASSVRALDTHFAAQAPYMLWVHQRPTDGGDWPTAHLHLHLVTTWRSTGTPRFVAAGELGSAVYFNPVAPGDAAAALRTAATR